VTRPLFSRDSSRHRSMPCSSRYLWWPVDLSYRASRFVVAFGRLLIYRIQGSVWGRVSTRRDATTLRHVWARRRRERHIVCRVREAIGWWSSPSRPSVTRAGIKHSMLSLVPSALCPSSQSSAINLQSISRNGDQIGDQGDAAPIGPPVRLPTCQCPIRPRDISCISRTRLPQIARAQSFGPRKQVQGPGGVPPYRTLGNNV
jgi:hypothetical protein